MVGVAQLVEHKVVALVAAGSSPVAHPKFKPMDEGRGMREEASLVLANEVSAHPSSIGCFLRP